MSSPRLVRRPLARRCEFSGRCASVRTTQRRNETNGAVCRHVRADSSSTFCWLRATRMAFPLDGAISVPISSSPKRPASEVIRREIGRVDAVAHPNDAARDRKRHRQESRCGRHTRDRSLDNPPLCLLGLLRAERWLDPGALRPEALRRDLCVRRHRRG
jgi:hypothetical protein